MSSALHPPLAGRTVLITGIQGFIGIHTAAAAYRLGARVAGMDIVAESARARRVRESLGAPPVEVRAVDLLDPQASGQALRAMRPDVVVHCAGSIERDAGTEDWARVFSGNAALTASLVKILRALPGTERPVLVMPGSQMEYGAAPMPWTEDQPCEPINAYGAGKLAATESVVEAARRDELRACVLRLPIVFGPGQPPALFVPELIGKAPNVVWSWDITKLRSATRGVYYELYVIIDIFSRYVVGWMVAATETGDLAKDFIEGVDREQGITKDQLTLHADRGTSMTSKPVAQLLVDRDEPVVGVLHHRAVELALVQVVDARGHRQQLFDDAREERVASDVRVDRERHARARRFAAVVDLARVLVGHEVELDGGLGEIVREGGERGIGIGDVLVLGAERQLMTGPQGVSGEHLRQRCELPDYRLERDDPTAVSDSTQVAGELAAVCANIEHAVDLERAKQVLQIGKFGETVDLPFGKLQSR